MMNPFGINEEQSHYDVLEVQPDASPHEIRSAYLKLKSAYGKDSIALYSLVSAEETEELIKKIEVAYNTLSSSDKRREYDRDYQSKGADPFDPGTNQDKNTSVSINRGFISAKIVSIDRTPPMETIPKNEAADILVSPKTDFSESIKVQNTYANTVASNQNSQFEHNPKTTEIDQLVLGETDWRGETLRKIREMRGISIEELSEQTRVSRSYLNAIEDENFSKLPATVFLRGFLVQISKSLRIPGEKVVTAYLHRCNKNRT